VIQTSGDPMKKLALLAILCGANLLAINFKVNNNTQATIQVFDVPSGSKHMSNWKQIATINPDQKDASVSSPKSDIQLGAYAGPCHRKKPNDPSEYLEHCGFRPYKVREGSKVTIKSLPNWDVEIK
jgi:hypothetical protein